MKYKVTAIEKTYKCHDSASIKDGETVGLWLEPVCECQKCIEARQIDEHTANTNGTENNMRLKRSPI